MSAPPCRRDGPPGRWRPRHRDQACPRQRHRCASVGPAPPLRRVADVVLAHLGRSITSLGDLDIPGFYGSELRQHARRLLDSGDARGEWRALVRSEPGIGPRVRPRSSPPSPTPSAAFCDDYGPRVAYHQPGGQVLRLHPACQAIWLEARDRPADPRIPGTAQPGRCAALTRFTVRDFIVTGAIATRSSTARGPRVSPRGCASRRWPSSTRS